MQINENKYGHQTRFTFSQYTKICGGRDRGFMCEIIKSKNTQTPGVFSHYLFGKCHIS